MADGPNGSEGAVSGNEDGNEGDASSITARGGWELGSYLFVGNGLQVVGLQTVPADRAGERAHFILLLLLSATRSFSKCRKAAPSGGRFIRKWNYSRLTKRIQAGPLFSSGLC